MFVPTSQSRRCDCGGKSCLIPSVRTKHLDTKKHKLWRWQTLCEAMLDLTLSRDAKIDILKELKTLVAVADEPRRAHKSP
jgi:hypothetical protein